MRSFIFFFFFSILFAACGQIQSIYTTKNGAIKGYDPVAYFKESKPVKGKEEFAVEWMGANWYFSSAENKLLFEPDPDKYAPQFGGYCAYGVANGGLFKIEPEAWKIVKGKLYLNYNLKYHKEWETNLQEYISQGQENWPKLKNK